MTLIYDNDSSSIIDKIEKNLFFLSYSSQSTPIYLFPHSLFYRDRLLFCIHIIIDLPNSMVQYHSKSNVSVDVKLINTQFSDLNHKTSKNDALCRLTTAACLCFIFVIAEVIGGILSSSLAILSDAAHLFADFASFIVAIFAERIARLPPNTSNTFGYHRAEALAALYSMSILLVVSIFLAAEALRRGYVFLTLTDEEEPVVNGKIMSITAGFGVVVNICLAFVLDTRMITPMITGIGLH